MNLTLGEKIPAGYVEIILEKEKGTRLRDSRGHTTLVMGDVDMESMTLRKLRILIRKLVRTAISQNLPKIAIALTALRSKHARLSEEKLLTLFGTEAMMASYEPTRYKSEKKPLRPTDFFIYAHATPAMKKALVRGVEIGKAINACRELANTPGKDMTPRLLSEEAKKAVKKLPVRVSILGEREMKKLRMGAILGVSAGSTEEATFTILEYRGSKSTKEKPIVLIGKGVTFDSGGLNLKPETGIYEMHMDMSGAAAVISAVSLAARLKIKKHVIGLIPATENMPGNQAYRPGDVLTSLSGKTIEVLNTDAEGRLILADAITYAKRFKPSVVIDAATLTGASMIALGLQANGLMTRDDRLASILEDTGEESGDYVWRLPLWDEYEDAVKGTFADVANVPGNGAASRYGGAIHGGMFLWQFAKELACPWAHLDIAPRMTAIPNEELAKGAAGAPVRLLISFIERWTESGK